MINTEKCNKCQDSFKNHNDVMSIIAHGYCCWCFKDILKHHKIVYNESNNINIVSTKNDIKITPELKTEDIDTGKCTCGNTILTRRFGNFCSKICKYGGYYYPKDNK